MNQMIGSDRFFQNSRTSVDDSLLYLGVIHAILPHCRSVIDVGCGRGSYSDTKTDPHNLFDLRGPGREILGLDVDPIAKANPFIDRFLPLLEGDPWPTADNSADLVVADWTLEHVKHPSDFVHEVTRTLHVGGAFVARSVSYYSILSLISRLVPNKHHAKVLHNAQPTRPRLDVFPAYYRMNTPRALDSLFGRQYAYTLSWRPGLENYLHARLPRLSKAVAVTERLLPQRMHTAFVLCARLNSKES